MGIISILDPDLSNKIAAGEVVERPLSVVKELVENSIDAGSRSITVEIKNGGITYIRVSDDGCGMATEDSKIAFLRHATSKIKTQKDLDSIYTLGFRGEALSSIASVAYVDLYTKRYEDENGTYVRVENGEIAEVSSAGVPNGTTIVVERLFYNTPARMKFLKKDYTEAGYIADMINRFILANPSISIRFINNGKEQVFSSGDSLLQNAIYTVYGKDYAKNLIAIDYNEPPYKITGYIGKSELARANRSYQSFFINKRYIKSALLVAALEEAFKNQIMNNKFPTAVVHIEVNPSIVDINVHPTKLEVKFAEEKKAYEAIYFGVKNALYSLSPQIKAEEVQTQEIATFEVPEKEQAEQQSFATKEILKKQEQLEPKKGVAYKTYEELQREEPQAKTLNEDKKSGLFRMRDDTNDNVSYEIVPEQEGQYKAGAYKELDLDIKEEKDTLKQEVETTTRPVENMSTEKEKKSGFEKDNYKIVGQLFNTYIIIEQEFKMLLIDQHAAHERLYFEEIKKAYQNNNVSSQMLLAPTIVSLSKTEMNILFENKDFFENSGFDIDEFGQNDVIVRSVPMDIEHNLISDLIVELVSMLGDNRQNVIADKIERGLYTIACKSAIKANRALKNEEITALVDKISTLGSINTCPHGRPIVVAMTKYELEKMFKRIV